MFIDVSEEGTNSIIRVEREVVQSTKPKTYNPLTSPKFTHWSKIFVFVFDQNSDYL
jgi:hypothetical protein